MHDTEYGSVGICCAAAIHAGLSHRSSSTLLSYLDSKPSADATHARGGIGQLQSQWEKEYAARP